MTRLITHALFSTHDIRHEYASPQTIKHIRVQGTISSLLALHLAIYVCMCVCVYGIPHISIFVFMGSLETVFFFFVSGKENKVFTMPAIVRVLSMLKDCKRFQ